ncbi:hypothetical protein WBG83_11190 [Paenibacillus sp. y28]
MHKSAIALVTVAVALMVVKPATAKALDCPEATLVMVATILVPLRKVNVIAAELVETLDRTPDAAIGVGLGPKIRLAKVVPAPTG